MTNDFSCCLSPLFSLLSLVPYNLQRTQGKRLVPLVGMEAIAHFGIDGADEVEKQGVEVLAGGKAGGDGGFR